MFSYNDISNVLLHEANSYENKYYKSISMELWSISLFCDRIAVSSLFEIFVFLKLLVIARERSMKTRS